MTRKNFTKFAVVGTLSALITAGSVRAAVICVPAPFDGSCTASALTIQLAIDAARPVRICSSTPGSVLRLISDTAHLLRARGRCPSSDRKPERPVHVTRVPIDISRGKSLRSALLSLVMAGACAWVGLYGQSIGWIGAAFFGLGVVMLEAVATDAPAPLEQVFAGGEHRGAVHHHVIRVALLATTFHVHSGRSRFRIGPVVERRQPVLVLAVGLFHAVELHAVAVVAWSTAELVRIMNPEQFWVGVAHKRTLTPHILCRDLNGFADSEMAGLAAVHHAGVRIVDLLDADAHGPSLVNQALDLL